MLTIQQHRQPLRGLGFVDAELHPVAARREILRQRQGVQLRQQVALPPPDDWNVESIVLGTHVARVVQHLHEQFERDPSVCHGPPVTHDLPLRAGVERAGEQAVAQQVQAVAEAQGRDHFAPQVGGRARGKGGFVRDNQR